jgi:predicted RNA methylase
VSTLVDLPFTTDIHLRLLLSLDRGHNVTRAVRRATRAGDRVLDAGTGTGLLSFAALDAGAAEAVAVDRQHLQLARAVAEKNGLADRMTFVQADLMERELPGVDVSRPFDLLLVFVYTNHPLIDQDRARMVFDLRDRYCTPDVRMVPNGIRYTATAVERSDWDMFTEQIELDRTVEILQAAYGVDFRPLVDGFKQEIAVKRSRPTDPFSANWRPSTKMASVQFPRTDVRLLGGPVPFHHIDYSGKAFTELPERTRLRIESPGRATGVVWTQELLHEGEPLWTTETYSPLNLPIEVRGGDEVTVDTGEVWKATNLLQATVRRSA